MRDKTTYDTMVRIAGSSDGIAYGFKAIADMYGWRHIVLLSDDEESTQCWNVARPFDEVLGNDDNYTVTWLRLGSNPNDQQLDNILQQIRSSARGIFVTMDSFC